MERGGQLKISFGMIFSIILMVIFIAFAGYAIQKFLELQDIVQVGKFTDDFQADIDKIWRGSQGSVEKEYVLPKDVIYICFTDYSFEKRGESENLYNSFLEVYFEKENFFFYPVGSGEGLDSKEIQHINLEKITENENPFCVENINGKVKLIIKKNFGEALVTIVK